MIFSQKTTEQQNPSGEPSSLTASQINALERSASQTTGNQGPCRPVVFPPLNRQKTLKLIRQFLLNRIVGPDPVKYPKFLDDFLESKMVHGKLPFRYKLFLFMSFNSLHCPHFRASGATQEENGENLPTNERTHLLHHDTAVHSFRYITPYALTKSLMPALRPGAKQIIMPDGRRLEFSKAKLFALRFIMLPLSIILTVLNVIISLAFRLCFSFIPFAILLIFRKLRERRPLYEGKPVVFNIKPPFCSSSSLYDIATDVSILIIIIPCLSAIILDVIPRMSKATGASQVAFFVIMIIVSQLVFSIITCLAKHLSMIYANEFMNFVNKFYQDTIKEEHIKALELDQKNNDTTDPLQQSRSTDLQCGNSSCICEQLEASEELSNIQDFALNPGLSSAGVFVSGFGCCFASVVVEDIALSPGNMLASILALGVHKMGKDVTKQSPLNLKLEQFWSESDLETETQEGSCPARASFELAFDEQLTTTV